MNIPNILSLIRLGLIPVFVGVYFSGLPHDSLIAGLIFLVAFLTDVADGYIARRFNMITRLGRLLDPMADKLMKATAVTCMTIRGVIPIWVIIILVAKELTMLIGSIVFFKRLKDVPSSNWFGKVAEGYLCALVFFLIIVELPFPVIVILWCIALLLELLALSVYTAKTYHALYGEKKGTT